MAHADSRSIINILLCDAIAIAHNGCSYGWAAQVFKCFAEHGKSSPLVAGATVEVQPDELLLSLQMQQQAAFDDVPLDPRSCPGPGVKLCTYRRWFSHSAHQVCPVYWEVPMSTAKLQRILRFRGLTCCQLSRAAICACLARGVCRLCHTGALGDERHMLLECPALADLRDEYSPLRPSSMWLMTPTKTRPHKPMLAEWTSEILSLSLRWLQSAQVSWLGFCGTETSPWSAGTSLLASIECHADDRQTLFHAFSLVGCQG